MLPSDLDHGAPRVKAFDHDRATEAQQDAVDLLEEARETTVIRFALPANSSQVPRKEDQGEDPRSQ